MHVEDLVVLVDDNDVPTGRLEEKLEAHRRGDLHRAFSVLLSDGTGRLLGDSGVQSPNIILVVSGRTLAVVTPSRARGCPRRRSDD